MFQVQCLQSTEKTETELYSKYYIGPFIKGQSTTIGNTLRRVLLSSLQGLAIVGARINDINHEFSTIPHVKEDVIDILLNLKQIVFKGNINEPTLARLKVKGPGIITAQDIELPPNVKLIDPRQYIATITAKGDVEMEFLITRGQNYLKNTTLESIIPSGFLSVDAVFMPVKKVNFFVETAQTGNSSELESLILEIWTNGSLTPAEALSTSAEVLGNSFELLKITNTTSTLAINKEIYQAEDNPEQLDTIFIEELELSVRAYNCLKRANIHTVSDLMKYSANDLLEFKNFGQKSADEVCESLKKRFDMDLRK
jgi:DNA-directed RNA polymerase subunit alpha|uniref:DNA-directed RNA polymerase subunit alpha n=2 Tax=Chrysochromulina TaxID=35140 RepID=A0A075DWG9_9EUKA|nr:DNA-directed RNA polymerase alpha chain [Chrysochromulina parva]AHY04341.1 DNA-directed RNA polymerase alpha chain [Chrysochromulina tobinii]AUS84368.1 DNA-directed RNA polymerase alpha chain [Chrysochromulina parva]